MIYQSDVKVMISMVFLTTISLFHIEAYVVQSSVIKPKRSDLFELSVVHLNDFHAVFVQIRQKVQPCLKGFEDECFGGIARISTASNQLLNERPNAIFLNAGDNFQGTPWYNIYRWNVTATFMNMLKLDASTLGNHEFDDGIDGLLPFLKMIKSPVVVTNIDASREPEMQNLYSNSTIIYRNNTKIGIIGVIHSNTNLKARTGNLTFFNEVESVNSEAERLKNRGVDIIIVLSHVGLDRDRIMAAECPNVDIIVGGHTHTFLYSGTPPSFDVPEDKYPVVVTQENNNRTVLIVQAASRTKYLGNLSVWFDAAGEVMDWEGNPIFLDHSVKEDPQILDALEPWKMAIDEFDKKIVGSTLVELNNNCRTGECNLGNLVTDAMVNAYVQFAENDSWTYAAVAFTNAGGLRFPASRGNITYNQIITQQPFSNTWDVLELRGSDLIEILEHSVSKSWSSTKFIGQKFLQWSGIKVTFNLENKVYSRVTDLKIRCRTCYVPVYENVVMDKWYRIVVPSFLVDAGDGYTIIQQRKRNHIIGTRDVDHYVRYVKKISPIIIGIEGRLILNGIWRD